MPTWMIISLAALFEVGWAVGLKKTEGFAHPVSAWVYICMILSIMFLGAGMKGLPIGTVYAVWTGLGTLGTLAAGIYFFGEDAGLCRLIFASLILVGIVGLGVVDFKAER